MTDSNKRLLPSKLKVKKESASWSDTGGSIAAAAEEDEDDDDDDDEDEDDVAFGGRPRRLKCSTGLRRYRLMDG
jgi:hypothetical protein